MTMPGTQNPWSLAPADPVVVDALAQATGLSKVTARVFVARGMSTAEQVERFLSPSLERDWLPAVADSRARSGSRAGCRCGARG